MNLFEATEAGDVEEIKHLLKIGADVNAKDNLNGRTPLHIAARAGHAEIINLLLRSGANVNAKDKNGSTALHIAVGLEKLLMGSPVRIEIIDLLIKSGADVNARDDYGSTALHEAIRHTILAPLYGSEIIDVLLKSGANVNAKTNEGETPFYLAAKGSTPDIVSMLIKSGANGSWWKYTLINSKLNFLSFCSFYFLSFFNLIRHIFKYGIPHYNAKVHFRNKEDGFWGGGCIKIKQTTMPHCPNCGDLKPALELEGIKKKDEFFPKWMTICVACAHVYTRKDFE